LTPEYKDLELKMIYDIVVIGTYVEVYGKTCEVLFKTMSPSRKSD
jgi:hypothetical protein